MYVASVPSLPGTHIQAETIDELLTNLKEVVELCLDELNLKKESKTLSRLLFKTILHEY